MRRMEGVRVLPVGLRQYGVPGWFLAADFSPTQVPGLTLWLEASDAETLFQDTLLTTPATEDGDPVGGWRDKAGGTYHALQSTASKRPTLRLGAANGKASLEFDGTDDYLAVTPMTGSFGGGFSFFLVLRFATTRPPTLTRPLGGRQGGTHSYFDMVMSTGGTLQQMMRIDGSVYAVTFNVYGDEETGYNVLGCLAQPDVSMAGYYNANSSGDVSLVAANWGNIASLHAESPYLGALNNGGNDAGHFVGNLAEVLIYDRSLSAGHRQQVERYLMQKYGVTA